jgi:Flp pilus assembly protein TadD
VIVVLVAGWGYTTHARNGVIRTQFNLWSDNAEKAPGLSLVHTNLGKQYFDRGNYEKAYGEYIKAIRLKHYMNTGQEGIAYHNLGWYYIKREGKREQGLACIKKAAILSPGYPEFRSSLAYLLMLQKDPAGAEGTIREALRLWPDNPALLSNAGVILLAGGRSEEAREVSLRALSLDPDAIGPLATIGETLRRQGHYGAAAFYWERYLERAPYSRRACVALFELYAKTGDRFRASKVLALLMESPCAGRREQRGSTSSDDGGFTNYVPDTRLLSRLASEVLLGRGPAFPAGKKKGGQ